MKNFVLGTIAAVVLATAFGAYSADEQKSGSPMGGMARDERYDGRAKIGRAVA